MEGSPGFDERAALRPPSHGVIDDMIKNGRFFVGLIGVALAVTYLVWTGVSDTMVYYLTPDELVARVAEDPSFHEVGIKISGEVVEGSYEKGDGELNHRFVVRGLEDGDAEVPIVYGDILPDTFQEGGEVVVEGRFRQDGVFEATTVLAKCGSRYEASPEELRG